MLGDETWGWLQAVSPLLSGESGGVHFVGAPHAAGQDAATSPWAAGGVMDGVGGAGGAVGSAAAADAIFAASGGRGVGGSARAPLRRRGARRTLLRRRAPGNELRNFAFNSALCFYNK